MSDEERVYSTAGSDGEEGRGAKTDPDDIGPFETPPSTCDEDSGEPDFPIQGQ